MMKTRINLSRFYDWVPYFGLVCLLVLAYIATVHSAERKIRKINEKHKEIEEIRREYIMIKRDVQHEGTLYEVAKDMKGVDMTKEIHIPRRIEDI